MKRKNNDEEKKQVRKEVREMFLDGFKFISKLMIFAFIALIIFAITGQATNGRIIPYFGLTYILCFYFLFARKSSLRVKVTIVVLALIMMAIVISTLGK